MDEEVRKITEGIKHIWEIRWQTSEIDKRKDDRQKHLANKENELKVAGCHVLLETMFGIKVADLINSAWKRLYD